MNHFGVQNCSVVATKCTFHDISLPKIWYKGDAGQLAQSGRLRFEQCRFVNCTVPERFLAATVRCIFENCKFEGTDGMDWSKAKRPLTVTAYVSGQGELPVSYANTQLRVLFKTGGMPVAGATIPVTFSGENLSLATVRPTSEVRSLGELPVPVLEKAAPPGLASVPPVTTPDEETAPPAPADPVIAADLERIEATAPTLVRAPRLKRASDAVALSKKNLGDEMFKLKPMRPLLSPKTRPYVDALVNYIDLIRAWQKTPPASGNSLSEAVIRLDAAAKRVREEREKINAPALADNP